MYYIIYIYMHSYITEENYYNNIHICIIDMIYNIHYIKRQKEKEETKDMMHKSSLYRKQ